MVDRFEEGRIAERMSDAAKLGRLAVVAIRIMAREVGLPEGTPPRAVVALYCPHLGLGSPAEPALEGFDAAAPEGPSPSDMVLPASLWPSDADADLVETAATNLDTAREFALEEGIFGEEEAEEDVEDCNLLRALAVRLRNAARIVREARAAGGEPEGTA